MILIIGSAADPHIKAVCAQIDRLGAEYKILDLLDNKDNNGDGLELPISERASLKIGKIKIDTSKLSAVWWRIKPVGQIPTGSITEYYDHRFCQREWTYLCNFLEMETSHIFSINERAKATKADNKLLQLRMAEHVGLKTPRTLVSNDPDAIVEFLSSRHSSAYIFKTLTPYMPPDGRITYTSIVKIEDIQENCATIRMAPGIYQELIAGKYELRLTVVGTEVFATRINHNSGIDVDWRREIYRDDIYESHQLSTKLRDQVLALHNTLGLFFSAYDVIIDTNDVPIFLETNPAGQWLWLERLLAHPISARIASALVQPPRRARPSRPSAADFAAGRADR
jgi:hypothetical protein